MRTGPRGFVLPLTLWTIALMGLAVAAINTWVSVAAENARALQLKVDDELAMANFKNELVFDLGTRSMSVRGLETGHDLDPTMATSTANEPPDLLALMAAPKQTSAYVSLDGRPYVWQSDPDYAIQLYDTRGLLNLNGVQQTVLQRFLGLFDVPETLRNQLPDTLTDWIDADDLTSLAGAEKTDYERLSRHPPSNNNLMTPLEAQSILGWDQVPAMWEADMRAPLFTTCVVSGFNPNTAPETTLLAYIAGMTKGKPRPSAGGTRQSTVPERAGIRRGCRCSHSRRSLFSQCDPRRMCNCRFYQPQYQRACPIFPLSRPPYPRPALAG